MDDEEINERMRRVEIRRAIAALFERTPAPSDLYKGQLGVCRCQTVANGPILYILVKVQAVSPNGSDELQYAVSSRTFSPYFDYAHGFCGQDFSGTTKLFSASMLRALPNSLLNKPELAPLKDE